MKFLQFFLKCLIFKQIPKSDLNSRFCKGCKKLFIGTRWSNRDIVGRLKSHNIFKGEGTEDITVSALDENDKSYCEEIHTTESLIKKRIITDELIWEAEWQQKPIEAKGLLFPPESLNYFNIDDLRLKEADGVIVVGDTADEGDDSLCVPVGYQYGEKIYIVDVVFTKEPIEVTVLKIGEFYIVDPILEEEELADTSITIAVAEDGTVYAMQKRGDTPLSVDEIDKMVEIAIKKSGELRKFIG